MSDRLVLALAQLNPVVGDIAGNCGKIASAWREAARQGADLVVATELVVTGYPPEDFSRKPALLKAVADSVKGLARETASGPALLLGALWQEDDKVYNAALLLDGGEIVAKVFKRDLPNYGPFDEKRVYDTGPLPMPVEWRGHKLGVMVCEDMWTPDAAAHLREYGAQILIVLNGSPFAQCKQQQRYALARERVEETGLPLVYVNQWGGQDELVFDGASFVMDAKGEVSAQAKAWADALTLINWKSANARLMPEASIIEELPDSLGDVYNALVVGVRDYVRKSGFSQVFIGLSGGIDSALVAVLAVDALGGDNVRTVMMPSPYTSQDSLDDADIVAKKLGVRLYNLPITPAMETFEQILAAKFAGCPKDLTEENIQSRCRSLILMALANKGNAMVLATANKSELAVGYSTLYGDMCGGYAPLKDVYKTLAYPLARWRNEHRPEGAMGPSGAVIPLRVMTKAPTAELRPNQKDQDSLPPYEVLDDILEGLIEDDLGTADIVKRGHDIVTVRRVWQMLDRAEYKRRQAAPGPKVTTKHLTCDRRYPIVNRYRER